MTPKQAEVVDRVRVAMQQRRSNGAPSPSRARKSDRRMRVGPDGKRHQVVVRDGVEGYLFDPMGARRWVPFDRKR